MYSARLTELLASIDARLATANTAIATMNTNLATLVSRSTPYTLTFEDDENSTLACNLVRLHGETLDLDTPVALATGVTVFVGDVIEFAATGEVGYDPVVTVGGAAVELDESGKYKLTVAGNVVAECTGEAEAEE
jgi:hypothetical protein